MKSELGHLSTLSDDELLETLRIDAKQFARAESCVAEDPNATIEPNRSADDTGLRALQALADMTVGRTLRGGLEMKRTLGEGGMGIVHLALQRSLGREVAVKTLRPEQRSEAAVLRLLREAWVTGALEHPNVVPVYDLSLDDGGAPIIVLKRIEGVGWDALMHDVDAIRDRFAGSDPLEWNIGILVRVAQAVSLAHSRGILHRDLKPENVMIGAFGEVYLVDWGIAVGLRPDPAGRIPSRTTDLAGTPAYMAPEMFGLGASQLSERTDVYLLGGILHEILTGFAPHRGGSFREMLVSSLLSQFGDFPEEAPAPLVAIARRALARDPAERFASADEFRQRIEWYLRHRGSVSLAAEASARLEEMKRAMDLPTEHDRVHRLFSECRFGYRAALRASDDNEEAREGLRAATEAVVRFELSRSAPEAAAAALAELADAPADLKRDVERAVSAKKEKDRRIERMQEDLDPKIGQRTRLFFTVILGTLWTAVPVVSHFLNPKDPSPESALLQWVGYSVGMSVVTTLLAVWARESMSKTALNRSLTAVLFTLFAAQLTLTLGCSMLGVPPRMISTFHLFLWFVAAALTGVTVERKMRPAAVAFLIGFFVAALRPEWMWLAMAGSGAVLAVVLLMAWRQPLAELRAPRR